MAERLVRSSLLTRLALDDQWTLVCHLAGRARVLCHARALALLDAYATPTPADSVPSIPGLAPEDATRAVDDLRATQLIVADGSDEAERFRHVYELPLRPPDLSALPTTLPLPGAATVVSAEDELVLSLSLATLELSGGRCLVTHPLGPCTELTPELWNIARAFAGGASAKEVASRLASNAARVARASDLLRRRRILWRTVEDERVAAAASWLPARAPLMDIQYPAAERWRQRFMPFDVPSSGDAPRAARVALVGPCKIQLVASALEWLAEELGWAVEITGVLRPERALGSASWSAVHASSSQLASDLYEALAAGDVARATELAPIVKDRVLALVEGIRAHTDAPLFLWTISAPGLWVAGMHAPIVYELRQVLASIQASVARELRGARRVWLVDEDRLAADFRGGAYWDDDLNATPHHSAISSWSWVVLKPGRSDEPYDREQASWIPPVPHGQVDPAMAGAATVLDSLRRLHDEPVRVVAFEPNELLWQGRLEDKTAYTTPPSFYADVEDYLHAGLHEALAALRRRGVALAMVSSCSPTLARERWRVTSQLRNVVRLDDVSAIADSVESAAAQLGVAEREVLHVDLTRDRGAARRRRDFGGRVYLGHPAHLRRYLLTAPELDRLP